MNDHNTPTCAVNRSFPVAGFVMAASGLPDARRAWSEQPAIVYGSWLGASRVCQA